MITFGRRRAGLAALCLHLSRSAMEASRAREAKARLRSARRSRKMRLFALSLLVKKEEKKRRQIARANGHWQGSTLYGYLKKGDAACHCRFC